MPAPKALKKQRAAPRALPAPEVIDGGTWDIEDSGSTRNAGVNITGSATGGQMVVPVTVDDQARAVRNHEMMHAKITPRTMEWKNELPDVLVQHCEDSRVHSHLNASGINLDAMRGILGDKELAPETIAAIPRSVRASMIAATSGTGEMIRVYTAVAGVDQAAANIGYQAGQAMQRLGTRSTFDHTLGTVRDIIAILGRPDEPEDQQPDSKMTEQIAQYADFDRPGEMAERIKQYADTTDDGLGDLPYSGNMVIETPPLSRSLPGKWKAPAKRRLATTGRKIRRPGRLHHDGMIFGEKKRTKTGGAVLIDVSGSMHLAPWEVDALMSAYPGGIVATYSGEDGRGILRVVAHKGKRVKNDDDLMSHYRGNEIDLPALQWLSKQTGPRFWVSDAGVGSMEILMACAEVCRRHNVQRVDRAGDLVDMRTA